MERIYKKPRRYGMAPPKGLCRAQGCKEKTRAIYAFDGFAVRLCPAHRYPDVKLKPHPSMPGFIFVKPER